MQLAKRVQILVELGRHLQGKDEYLEALMHRTKHHNGWFTIENQQKSVKAIAEHFLDEKKLDQWLAAYQLEEKPAEKSVGLVLAGNIPLVGFHDLLCIFVAGHKARVKLSEKDQYLLPYLLKLLCDTNPDSQAFFEVVPVLKKFDAVIATGSNNSARYFEAYFGKYPNIIRKNRNAVAVLTGEESQEELFALGKDIFQYFGLGCRNVSKIYIPEGYNFEPLLETLHEYRDIINHTKYKNNFDYNYALHVLNKVDYKANGCIILIENEAIASRIASLHYEFYKDIPSIEATLDQRADEIQCIVARPGVLNRKIVPFGKAQEPSLWDYADGVDTLEFLQQL